jgi:hypothetical protein
MQHGRSTGLHLVDPVLPGKVARYVFFSALPSCLLDLRYLVPLGLQVSYVAEHHEGLRHVLAFLNVAGMTPGVNLEASAVSGSNDTSGAESTLVLRSGSVVSSALALPARTQAGAQDVHVQGLHYEIKIATPDPQSPRAEPIPLLDAEQLRERAPMTFICASCSLPLVHGARVTRYDDLPSEHWAELVDAWMCHSDQVLNAQVSRHAKGFWPQSGQALVGGSYILFDKSAAVSANLRPMEKPKVRCPHSLVISVPVGDGRKEGRRW